MRPLLLGLAGPVLTAEDRAFLRAADPAGFLIMGRNVGTPDQLRALTADLRGLFGRDLLILVDQEGGRVARLGPPHWPDFPAAARFGALYDKAPISAIAAARANGAAIGMVLRRAGIDAAAMPVLDMPQAGADPVIGDRALGAEPMRVAALGRALLEGLAEGGAIGVMKHVPGHGRAGADSHERLSVVAAPRDALEEDWAPFRALAARAPAAMTAHILYQALDPERPATLSPAIVADVVRGAIGFSGLLVTDDIGMGALAGPLGQRAAGAMAAGCDLVLAATAARKEQEALCEALGPIGDEAHARLGRALAARGAGEGDLAALIARRDALLAYA